MASNAWALRTIYVTPVSDYFLCHCTVELSQYMHNTFGVLCTILALSNFGVMLIFFAWNALPMNAYVDLIPPKIGQNISGFSGIKSTPTCLARSLGRFLIYLFSSKMSFQGRAILFVQLRVLPHRHIIQSARAHCVPASGSNRNLELKN